MAKAAAAAVATSAECDTTLEIHLQFKQTYKQCAEQARETKKKMGNSFDRNLLRRCGIQLFLFCCCCLWRAIPN